MGAALGARDGVHLVEDHRLDAGQRVAGGRGEHQEQRLGGGDQDVRRAAWPATRRSAARGVAGADADPDLRLGQPQPHRLLPDAGQRAAQIALHVDREGLQRRHVQHAAALAAGRRAAGVDASRSSAARNAARVLPEPVGATTSTSEPSPMRPPRALLRGGGRAEGPREPARGSRGRRRRAPSPAHAPIVHPATDNGLSRRRWQCGAGAAVRTGTGPVDRADGTRMEAWRSGERARHWQYAGAARGRPAARPLRRARPSRGTPTRALSSPPITEGVEVFGTPAAADRAGPGALASDQPGHAAHRPRRGARGLGVRGALPGRGAGRRDRRRDHQMRGTPGFADATCSTTRTSARLITEVHRAAEEGNALAADSLLRSPSPGCCGGTAAPLPQRAVRTAGARTPSRPRGPRGADGRPADPGAARCRARHQPLRAAAGLPGGVRHAAAHLAHRRPRTPGARLLDAGLPPPRRPSPSASPTSRI